MYEPSSTSTGLQDPPPHKTSEQEKTEHVAQSSPSIPEKSSYKNRLQEFTQRLALPFPLYQTINEGVQHAPKFRSTVLVNGTYYTSPNTFSHIKAAEQDVARLVLLGFPLKIKDEGFALIHEDTVFCKSILYEYAVKMKLEKPTFETIRLEGAHPSFVSSLFFNGVTYTGEAARNKKEAERLAARAVILSILDSESGTIISSIIKSKSKLSAELNKVKDSDTQNDIISAGVQTGYNLVKPLSEGKELEAPGGTNNMPISATSGPSSGQPINIPATHPPFHEFKVPKPEPSSEAVNPLIVFVPPALQQPMDVGSTSGRKRNLNNEENAEKKVRVDA